MSKCGGIVETVIVSVQRDPEFITNTCHEHEVNELTA